MYLSDPEAEQSLGFRRLGRRIGRVARRVGRVARRVLPFAAAVAIPAALPLIQARRERREAQRAQQAEEARMRAEEERFRRMVATPGVEPIAPGAAPVPMLPQPSMPWDAPMRPAITPPAWGDPVARALPAASQPWDVRPSPIAPDATLPPVEITGRRPGLPAWVVPAAIGAGALLFLMRRR